MAKFDLTNDEKAELALASVMLGIAMGAAVSIQAFALSLIFLSFWKSMGIGMALFLPVMMLTIWWNVRLFVAKKKAELDQKEVHS